MSGIKYLIINADDFGKYESVNKGIIEGINAGVITSTSLMVYGKWAKGVSRIVDNENISIGLHFIIPDNESNINAEFTSQIALFQSLTGRKPDHIDSHYKRFKELPSLMPLLTKYVSKNNTPVRDLGYANFIDDFFALDRETFKEVDFRKISPDALISILNRRLVVGNNELMCHAGRTSEQTINKKYGKAREVELNTLLSDEFKNYLATHPEIKLISWNDLVTD